VPSVNPFRDIKVGEYDFDVAVDEGWESEEDPRDVVPLGPDNMYTDLPPRSERKRKAAAMASALADNDDDEAEGDDDNQSFLQILEEIDRMPDDDDDVESVASEWQEGDTAVSRRPRGPALQPRKRLVAAKDKASSSNGFSSDGAKPPQGGPRKRLKANKAAPAPALQPDTADAPPEIVDVEALYDAEDVEDAGSDNEYADLLCMTCGDGGNETLMLVCDGAGCENGQVRVYTASQATFHTLTHGATHVVSRSTRTAPRRRCTSSPVASGFATTAPTRGRRSGPAAAHPNARVPAVAAANEAAAAAAAAVAVATRCRATHCSATAWGRCCWTPTRSLTLPPGGTATTGRPPRSGACRRTRRKRRWRARTTSI